MLYKIYTLSDPNTHEIRYIGKTKSKINTRLKQHIRDTYKYNNHRVNWIKSILCKGKMPIIELLDETDKNWQILECYWISQFKAWGFNLTNMTDGGDGNNNQIASEESRKKRSLSLLGKKRPEEVRKKISKAHKGKKLSDATKEKLKQANLGKVASEESKRKKFKPILLVDSEGSIIEEFESLSQAAKKYNCHKGAISNACSGTAKTACNRFWKFKK